MGMGPRMREDTDYEWGAFLLNLLGLIMALLCLREGTGGSRTAPTGEGMGMGPRMREDTGGCEGFTPIPRLHEGRL